MTYEVRAFQIALVQPPTGLECFTWPALFRTKQRPTDLEIGCGVGWHPISQAKSNPDRNLIAIEHTRNKFERFESRLAHHDPIPNLLPIHGDAIRWVTHTLEPGSIDRVFILYPNPEPKAPNKRWLRMPFMHQLLATLKPRGEIVLATNERAYWQEAQDWALKAWDLEIVESRNFDLDHAPTGVPRTHFEKKYLRDGQTCYDLVLRKTTRKTLRPAEEA